MRAGIGIMIIEANRVEGALVDGELDDLVLMLTSGRSLAVVQRRAEEILSARGCVNSQLRHRSVAPARSFILGNHRLLERIGKGATYDVLLAQHLFTGRIDALKVLHPEAARSRHVRRLRTQASITNRRLVSVHDVGFSRGVDFAVVEYVPGDNLRAHVRKRGALSMVDAARITSDIAVAIGYVHSLGFVYGGLHPSKVLLGQQAVAKLSDTGTADRPGRIGAIEEATGKLVDFLSPEIAAREQVTTACDIYSLGCMLYYAVTAKVPFPGGTDEDKRLRHASHYPIDPRRLSADLDDDFVSVIAAMMSKSPSDRIRSTGDAVAQLKRWAIAAVEARE